MPVVILTADLIEALAGTFLSPRYDDPRPTPQFHREAWKLYSSSHPSCMVIAPRDHAKTTGLTYDYVMAEVLFRTSDYVIIISSTEEMAQEIMSNISEELHENTDLRSEFGVKKFLVDSKTDIIVEMTDGHKFRILARGAEQRIRGRIWNGKRPNLLVCDDMEDDEQVENRDRRQKFRRWFFRAAKQALSKKGKIRVHGTILHEDSLLSRLRKSSVWKHHFYKAHESFSDFSNILWPERWTETELRRKRQEFIDDMDSAGYSQEMLNDPMDSEEAYIKRDDLIPMEASDYDSPKIVCAAADFAISKRDKANRTSFTIGGKDVDNILHIFDQWVDRWDTLEIINVMFKIQVDHNPEVFWVEDGKLWKAIAPVIYREMQVRDIRINIEPIMPVSDKASRGRSFQKRTRARMCRFDKKALWYPEYEYEILRFTGYGEATLDDQFDSTALLSKGFDEFREVEKEDFYDEEEFELAYYDPRKQLGRNGTTGY